MADTLTDTGSETVSSPELDYHALNAKLNLYDADGRIQFDADHEAARQYFLQHVNQNTVFFHDLEEKLEYLVEEGYYEGHILDKYSPEFVKSAFKAVYGQPIATYMKEARVREAMRLLRETDSTNADIAAAVGYESQGKFTLAFKDVAQALPTEYRRQHRA